MMSYNLSEIQKAKISVSSRKTGLEKMKVRHEDELRLKELELKAAETYLAMLLFESSNGLVER